MAATTLYVRKGGSDNNGGSSSGTSAQRTGADGVTNGSTTFTSASASFVSGDVDKLINIVGKGRYRITGFTNSTTVTLSGSPSSGSSLTWNIGGAVASMGALLANSTGAVAGGDTIYVGGGGSGALGVYREVITIGQAPSSVVSVIGDVDGSHTGDSGGVILSDYTTNDTTAGSTSANLNGNSKANWSFSKLMIFKGNSGSVITMGTDAHDWSFTDCMIFGGSGNVALLTSTSTAGGATALNLTIDRCSLYTARGSGYISITCNQSGSSSGDNDLHVTIKNSFFSGNGTCVAIASTSSTGVKPGGVNVRNCTAWGASTFLSTGAGWSTAIPATVNNCLMLSGASGSTCLSANTSGQITEDYNIIWGFATPRANVTAGTHSISDTSRAPLVHLGQERIFGDPLWRAFCEPMSTSPILGFGNDGNQSAYDMRNKPKPAGGASASPAVGALERANTFATELSVTNDNTTPISCTGPAYAEFLVPVKNGHSTTISVYARQDSTYAGTKPQIQIDAQGRIGVSAQTVTSTAAANSWQQISLSSFTPTANGLVVVRVLSNDTNGAGRCYFDTFAIA